MEHIVTNLILGLYAGLIIQNGIWKPRNVSNKFWYTNAYMLGTIFTPMLGYFLSRSASDFLPTNYHIAWQVYFIFMLGWWIVVALTAKNDS